MDNLIKHIQKYIHLSADEVTIITETLQTISVEKETIIHQEGEVCRFNYFVCSGCLRMYFIKENGTEQIVQFAIENWWISDYMSLMTNLASEFYIQAIEPAEIIRIDNPTADRLFEKAPKLERYFRLISQRAYAATQFRIKYLYSLSREELYVHFVTHFPEFLQRVPQYMLASYLGFTPEYLSKLRKKNR